ncbi:MAG: hypothetical protein AB9834_08110 [Lentimicrobium sp.]
MAHSVLINCWYSLLSRIWGAILFIRCSFHSRTWGAQRHTAQPEACSQRAPHSITASQKPLPRTPLQIGAHDALKQLWELHRWNQEKLNRWLESKLTEIDEMLAGSESAGKVFYTFKTTDVNGKELSG